MTRRSLIVAIAMGFLVFFSGFARSFKSITVCPMDCDFASIQAAIDAAKPGDTIEVNARKQPYAETLNIATPELRLIAEAGGVTLDGGGGSAAITVTADGVEIVGFLIQNATVGIVVERASSVKLVRNVFQLVGEETAIEINQGTRTEVEANGIYATMIGSNGILLVESNQTQLRGNLLFGQHFSVGIRLERSGQNTLRSNTISFGFPAIELVESDDNTLEANDASTNGGAFAIHLVNSARNLLSRNTATDADGAGIFLENSHQNRLLDNDVGLNFLGFALESAHQNLLRGNRGTGLRLNVSHENMVLANVWKILGFTLTNANRNVLKDNIVLAEPGFGPAASLSDSNENLLEGNALLALNSDPGFVDPFLPHDVGLQLDQSQKNIIWGNEIQGHRRGVLVLDDAAENTFRFNKVHDNLEFGLENKGEVVFDARFNWWGDPTGPHHAELNSNGQGNDLSAGVEFQPWLDAPTEA